jgi:hypothetical protein
MPSFARYFDVQPPSSDLGIDELVQDIDAPLNDSLGIDEPTLTGVDFEEIEIML